MLELYIKKHNNLVKLIGCQNNLKKISIYNLKWKQK